MTATTANAGVTAILGGPVGPFSTLSVLGLDGGTTATLVGGSVYNTDLPFADTPEAPFGGTFLAAGPIPGQPATLTFNVPVKALSFLWGSPDTYNKLKVISTTGSYLFDPVSLAFPVTNGDQTFSQYVSFFTTLAGETITSAEFTNVPSINAFEVANFSVTTPVPEPATWAMMIVGFVGIGSAVRSTRRRQFAAA